MQEKRTENFMSRLARFIVDKRKAFYLVFIAAFLFSAAFVDKVEVNNDITSYLPPETETRRGLTVMEEEFVTLGSANVMVSSITYVRGRKGIGGIVGQFEPSVKLTYGNSPFEQLSESLSSLLKSMELFSDQVNGMTSRGINDAEDLNASLQSIKDRVQYAGSEGKEDFSVMSDSLFQYSTDMNANLNTLLESLSRFANDSNEDLENALIHANNLLESLDALLDIDNDLKSDISSFENTVAEIRFSLETANTHIGISLTGHYSGYSKVNSTRTLTRTAKAGSSDFFISGDGWYAGIGSDTIPVSSEVQIYLTSSDTWLSGEDGLNAVLSGGYDLTLYYDKTPSSGGQIRIITAG